MSIQAAGLTTVVYDSATDRAVHKGGLKFEDVDVSDIDRTGAFNSFMQADAVDDVPSLTVPASYGNEESIILDPEERERLLWELANEVYPTLSPEYQSNFSVEDAYKLLSAIIGDLLLIMLADTKQHLKAMEREVAMNKSEAASKINEGQKRMDSAIASGVSGIVLTAAGAGIRLRGLNKHSNLLKTTGREKDHWQNTLNRTANIPNDTTRANAEQQLAKLNSDLNLGTNRMTRTQVAGEGFSMTGRYTSQMVEGAGNVHVAFEESAQIRYRLGAQVESETDRTVQDGHKTDVDLINQTETKLGQISSTNLAVSDHINQKL